MAFVEIKITSNTNISMQTQVETYIPEEEWAEMTSAERQSVISDAVWQDIDAYPVTDEDDENVLEV